MPRGAPDYSNVRAGAPIHRLDDMAELAARLWSPVTFDRAGRVVWMDDFNSGLDSWVTVTSGTGAEVRLATTYPEFPPFCVLMTAGSNEDKLALLIQYFAPQELSPLGAEISLGFYSNWDYFDYIMYRFDGSTSYKAAVRLDYTNSKIKVLHSDNAWKDVAALPNLRQGNGVYHKLKFVGDFENNVYDRLILNQTVHDISSYAFYQSASAQGEHFQLHALFTGRAGNNDVVRADGVIITQNEP